MNRSRCVKCNKMMAKFKQWFRCSGCEAWYCPSCMDRYCMLCKAATQEVEAA